MTSLPRNNLVPPEVAEVLDGLKDAVTRQDRIHTVLRFLLERGCSKQLFEKVLNMCPDPECDECGKLVCINGEPLHFHHDGCPGCDGKITRFDQIRMNREDELLWSGDHSEPDWDLEPILTKDDDRGPSHSGT